MPYTLNTQHRPLWGTAHSVSLRRPNPRVSRAPNYSKIYVKTILHRLRNRLSQRYRATDRRCLASVEYTILSYKSFNSQSVEHERY
jgi:hypothetical protein